MDCAVCHLPLSEHAEAHGLSDGSVNNCALRCTGSAAGCRICSGGCYPAHRFTPPTISSFRGSYRFLSNFWIADVVIHQCVFPSTEHAYQAMKCARREDWVPFQDPGMTPAQAKKRINSRAIPRRPDWYELRVPHMHYLVRDKFTRHAGLRDALLATGEATLVEGNDWGDRFWGVCGGTGENMLGRVLVAVRSEIRGGLTS